MELAGIKAKRAVTGIAPGEKDLYGAFYPCANLAHKIDLALPAGPKA
jgi:hypothetical protein